MHWSNGTTHLAGESPPAPIGGQVSARLSEQVVTTNVGAALENLGAALGATTARHQPGRVNHRQRLVYTTHQTNGGLVGVHFSRPSVTNL